MVCVVPVLSALLAFGSLRRFAQVFSSLTTGLSSQGGRPPTPGIDHEMGLLIRVFNTTFWTGVGYTVVLLISLYRRRPTLRGFPVDPPRPPFDPPTDPA